MTKNARRTLGSSLGCWILLCIFLLLTSGCKLPERKETAPSDKLPTYYEDIICLSLMVQMPLLDVDGDKIPDGVAMKIYLNRPNQNEFVAGKGSLILHMYRSRRDAEGKLQKEELRAWTVNQEDFARAVVRQGFGLITHQMAVYWDKVPYGPGVYLQAEFIRTDNQHLWSRSISLPLQEKPRQKK